MNKLNLIKKAISSVIKEENSIEKFDPINSAKRTIKQELQGVIALKKILDDNFVKAVNAIASSKGRVIITGIGKSGHIGKKIAATMASTGTPAFFVHPAEASHGDLGMLTNDDIVIAISKSGESKELSDIITYCKRYDITLIGIAQFKDSSLIKQSDIPLMLPDIAEACPLGIAPTTSTTTTIVLGDALAMALLEKNQFSKEQFKLRHPGGKLGQNLIKVEDLMHTGNKIPLINKEDAIKAAVEEISKKKAGCVGVIDSDNNLVGVITDGDLRRHLCNDFFKQELKDIMTVNPITTTAETLAVEATGIMNKMSITNLFVCKDKKPVGILHIHDCLKAGIL